MYVEPFINFLFITPKRPDVKFNVVEHSPLDDGSTHRDLRTSLPKPIEISVLPTMTLKMFRLKFLKTLKMSNSSLQKIRIWQWLDGHYVFVDQNDLTELNLVGIENDSELLVHVE